MTARGGRRRRASNRRRARRTDSSIGSSDSVSVDGDKRGGDNSHCVAAHINGVSRRGRHQNSGAAYIGARSVAAATANRRRARSGAAKIATKRGRRNRKPSACSWLNAARRDLAAGGKSAAARYPAKGSRKAQLRDVERKTQPSAAASNVMLCAGSLCGTTAARRRLRMTSGHGGGSRNGQPAAAITLNQENVKTAGSLREDACGQYGAVAGAQSAI